jgi:tRNA threonylcarbamoyladenosine biosynthesis protein TsaE
MEINSPAEMKDLGKKIGKQLSSTDVVILSGELGSGKTVLTQGIAAALGFDQITSPTFVISRIYKGKPNFIHADAYRLLDTGVESFTDLDFESYLSSSVFVIEWGAPLLQPSLINICILKLAMALLKLQGKLKLLQLGSGGVDLKYEHSSDN